MTKPEEDALIAAYDDIDIRLGRLLADYRKVKRDRQALLTTCWHLVAVLTRTDRTPDADIDYAASTLRSAIADAEKD